MATQIFLGEPPANIKQWIIDHATPLGPATHTDTWYKYVGDTEWRTVSITGVIEGEFDDDMGDDIPTTQIPHVYDVIAIEIGSDVTSIGFEAFYGCVGLTSITTLDNITIGTSAFSGCSGLTTVTIVANGGNAESVKQAMIDAGAFAVTTWNMPS